MPRRESAARPRGPALDGTARFSGRPGRRRTGCSARSGPRCTLNAAWPALFFGLHSPLAAFVEICVLWAAIVLTILLFWPVRRLAAVLLLPYLAWVSFAACLNFAFWRLNA